MLWKDVSGYEGCYQVSSTGEVKSLDKYDRLGRFKQGVMKSMVIQNSGYKIVNLKVDGQQKNRLVHRLVAESFISKPDGKDFVNHINGDKLDNRIENLEWCTRSENMKHATDIGLLEIVNRRPVRIIKDDISLLFKSQFQVSHYFGFTDGWCHQQLLRNGNPFSYNGYSVEVLN